MPSFTLSNKAKDDLKEIGRYTEKTWGRKQRNVYLGMLDACFHQMAAKPTKGKECREIRDGYRKLTAGSHVIFFRQTSDDTIEIIRVLHGRMDIETRLSVT